MRVLVALEQRFYRTPDGKVWTNSTFTNEFWERYLTAFDSVMILARVKDVQIIAENWNIVGNDSTTGFIPLPFYVGPLQYLLKWRATRRSIQREIHNEDAIILRLPGAIGSTLLACGIRQDRPWGAEIVGDPFDVFAPGAVSHPLRPLFRWRFTAALKDQVRRAAAIAYVSGGTLQRRYPPSKEAFFTHYSSITLSKLAFKPSPRRHDKPLTSARFVLVGSMEQMYKGVDILIGAVAMLRSRNVDVRAVIVGDGRFRSKLEDYAHQLQVHDVIDFVGHMASREQVDKYLDEADVFVLPSRTEGLPRAMIEAMARGLPCIGSSVGGIPELLPIEALVPANDAKALADKLATVIVNPDLMSTMSSRNLQQAANYREEVLTRRRIDFYSFLRLATDQWTSSRNPQ